METWRDIVAEMRKQAYAWRQRKVPNFCELSDHWSIVSDRIEAACKTLEDVLIVEQEENEKLRRALEPVMKCAVCKADGTPVADGEICTSSDYGVCDCKGNALDWHDVAECLDAVREAQAIIKECAEMDCDECKHAVWHDGEIIDCKCEPIYDSGAPSDHKCCNGKFERKEESK